MPIEPDSKRGSEPMSSRSKPSWAIWTELYLKTAVLYLMWAAVWAGLGLFLAGGIRPLAIGYLMGQMDAPKCAVTPSRSATPPSVRTSSERTD